jgi:hypothetical protein
MAEHATAIRSADPRKHGFLHVAWNDGTEALVDLRPAIRTRGRDALNDPFLFAQVRIYGRGAGVIWPGGIEIPASELADFR